MLKLDLSSVGMLGAAHAAVIFQDMQYSIFEKIQADSRSGDDEDASFLPSELSLPPLSTHQWLERTRNLSGEKPMLLG
jgi:hypothetical protein